MSDIQSLYHSVDWKFGLFFVPILLYLSGIVRSHLKSWGAYLIEAAMFNLARWFHSALAGRLTLQRYCRLRLGEDNRYLFIPSSRGIKLEVDQAYVTLALDHHAGHASVRDHTNLLTVGNRIRVVGDPGSGKSSLVKRLLRDSCRAALDHPRTARLPILIELKKLHIPANKNVDELGDWLYERIRTDVAKCKVFKMAECFDTYVGGAGVLVLLDGLDEVSSADYPRVHTAIEGLSHELADRSDQNAIVLTMRTQFHMQVRDLYRETFGHVVALRPFTPTNIYEFLSRWPFGADAREQVTRIYKQLTDRSSLREMCSNPLVLSMYVADDQAKGQLMAPESRTEFYKKVTEELLIKRRLAQTGPGPATAFLREQRERILGRVAYEHLLNPNEPANALRYPAALAAIKDIVSCDAAQAAAIFDEISKETGLITEERPSETFRFIHLTFCEFLAAVEAVNGREHGWADLMARHKAFQSENAPYSRSRLVETIPFTCGLLPRVKRAAALSELAELNDTGLLARAFFETKCYEHPRWPAFVDQWKGELLTVAECNWNDEWLANLHLFNVVITDATMCALHGGIGEQPSLDSFFSSLVARQRDSLFKLLRSYATRDAAAALRLAQINHLDLASDCPEIVLAHCDQAPFFALVIEQALAEPQAANRWAPLLAEAALRSRIVAMSMSEMKEAPEWGLPAHAGRRLKWDNRNIHKRSFLTQCFTLAVQPDALVSPACTLLPLLRQAPGSGDCRGLHLGWSLSLLVCGPVVILLSMLVRVPDISLWMVGAVPSSWLGATGVLSMISGYYLGFRTMFNQVAYRQILYGKRAFSDRADRNRYAWLFGAAACRTADVDTQLMYPVVVDRRVRALLRGVSAARQAPGIAA